LGTAALSGSTAVLIVRNFLETEKKIKCPIRADYAAGDEVFVRTMGHLLGPPLLEGNKVTILQNGDEIFPAMLEGIRSAKRTITFENFLLKEGEVWRQFASAFAERARAGVKVHFLQDALGCNCLHGPEMKLLKRAGAEVEIFGSFSRSMAGSGLSGAHASRMTGRVTGVLLASGATRTTGSTGRSSRKSSRRSWITGCRLAPPCCTGTHIFQS
jgi:hypothetical protein